MSSTAKVAGWFMHRMHVLKAGFFLNSFENENMLVIWDRRGFLYHQINSSFYWASVKAQDWLRLRKKWAETLL